MTSPRKPILAAALLLAGACTQEPASVVIPTDGSAYNGSIESGGFTREYQFYVPATARSDRPSAVLIALHPDPGSSSDMRGISGFDQIARLLEIIMVYPEATTDWAEGCGCTTADAQGVDDVQFLRDVIDDLDTVWPVDRSRIYVAGFGQGGMMALNAACTMEEVAAVGVVGATLSVPLAETCDPDPIPMTVIHGTLDPFYPAGGRAAGSHPLLGIDETLDFFLEVNGCSEVPTQSQVQDAVLDGTSVNVAIYEDCAGDVETHFYEVVNGGNTWPNPTINFPASYGLKTEDIDAAAVLGVFFLRH